MTAAGVVSDEIRTRLRQLKRGGETYDAVLKRILDRVEEAKLDIEPREKK